MPKIKFVRGIFVKTFFILEIIVNVFLIQKSVNLRAIFVNKKRKTY